MNTSKLPEFEVGTMVVPNRKVGIPVYSEPHGRGPRGSRYRIMTNTPLKISAMIKRGGERRLKFEGVEGEYLIEFFEHAPAAPKTKLIETSQTQPA
jgi:hypothetical protein